MVEGRSGELRGAEQGVGDEHTSGAGGRADKWSRGKSKGGQRAGAESRREHPSRSPSNNEQGLEGATWSQGLGLGLGGGHTWGALPLLTTRRRSAFTGTGITRFLAALQILAKDPLTVHTGAARGQGDARAQGSGMQTPPGVRVSHSWLLPHCALVLHTGLTSCLTHWKQPSFLPHTKPGLQVKMQTWGQTAQRGWPLSTRTPHAKLSLLQQMLLAAGAAALAAAVG